MSRLPDNFPPGTRFWLVTIDAFADAAAAGCTQLLRADSTVVEGDAAEALRQRAITEGVEISEAEFRDFAPRSFFDQFATIIEKAGTEPAFKKKIFQAIALESASTEHGSPSEEKVCREALRTSTDPEVQSFAAKLLLELMSRKQKRNAQ